MYNFENLNDYEFEVLCKDIMEKKLKIKLHRHGRGADGGIDLYDNNVPFNYVVQVKHYVNSEFSDLKKTLSSEILKVKKINPKNYYICCSINLLPQHKVEIYSLFKEYMMDISYIIDKNDLDDFLESAENKIIVEKNYKLWFCSTNILSVIQNQHIFIDCNELLDEIENQAKLFVTTKSFYECRNLLLNEKGILIITGSPGVGKSIISKMLLLFFANKGFNVRYSSDNNLKDLKKAVSVNPNEKEIILIDDFLGQHYLNLNEKQPNELNSLVSFIERNQNKKIILNSRITILNEANSSSIKFNDFMEKYENKNYLIDLNKMTYLEKAKILYNHLYFNNLPYEYFNSIKQNNNYIKIIKHSNFNPRIIEYVSKDKNYNKVSSNKYFEYIIDKLNNPDSVWEDEYRNRIEENDRIFMNTVYSLTNDKIEIEFVKNAFNKRVVATFNNTTLNIFEDILKRLNNSLIKIITDNHKRYISVVNPSVNDYLNKYINNNENELVSIIDNAYYIEQIYKFKTHKEIILNRIINNKINDLNSIVGNKFKVFFELLIDYDLKDLEIRENLISPFSFLCKDFHFMNDDVIIELIDKKFVDFYNLQNIILDNLEKMLKFFSYDNILLLYDWLEKKSYNNEKIKIIIKKGFINAIQEYITDYFNEEIQNIVESCINNLKLDINKTGVNDLSELHDLYIDAYADIIYNDMYDEALRKIEDITSQISVEIPIDDFDLNDILNYINIDEAICNYVDSDDIDLEDEYYKDLSKENSQNEWEIINEMFN